MSCAASSLLIIATSHCASCFPAVLCQRQLPPCNRLRGAPAAARSPDEYGSAQRAARSHAWPCFVRPAMSTAYITAFLPPLHLDKVLQQYYGPKNAKLPCPATFGKNEDTVRARQAASLQPITTPTPPGSSHSLLPPHGR